MISNIFKNIGQCALTNFFSNVIIFNMRRELFKFFKKLDRWDDKHPILSNIIFVSFFYFASIWNFICKSYLKASILLIMAIISTIIFIVDSKRNKH